MNSQINFPESSFSNDFAYFIIFYLGVEQFARYIGQDPIEY